jgi:hypothetical protein
LHQKGGVLIDEIGQCFCIDDRRAGAEKSKKSQ